MRILITGGTGFIGQALCPRLAAAGHEVVILTRQSTPALPRGAASAVTRLDDLDAGDFGAVINLAGAPIGDARWTESRKRLLLESRVGTTARVVEWMRRAAQPPGVLVSGSAVGYYGEQGDRPITEDTPPTPGFTHDLCAAWEREADKAAAFGVRVCRMRIGVVLDSGGGALAKMLPAFRLGAGGRLGSGTHYFPWIHREDIAAICQWLLERPAVPRRLQRGLAQSRDKRRVHAGAGAGAGPSHGVADAAVGPQAAVRRDVRAVARQRPDAAEAVAGGGLRVSLSGPRRRPRIDPAAMKAGGSASQRR